MNRYLLFFLLAMGPFLSTSGQGLDRNVEERLHQYFKEYKHPSTNFGTCKLDSFALDHQRRKLDIYPSVSFGYQPFTPESVEQIYGALKNFLPGPVNYYDMTIYADGKTIEDLVPNHFRKKQDKSRVWKRVYKGNPWTKNISRPYEAEEGLEGKHIVLWQSHGKYYIHKTGEWGWQRPRLYGTTEDMFTQSFVVPYLMPMLENAGAVVFTPRERDWQRNEVIVDNDGSGTYQEVKSRKGKWNTTPDAGFAIRRKIFTQDGQNPFQEGTARYAATEKKAEKAFAQWIPNIPETGRYAVYVSYQSLPNSVSDAKYLVFHKGGVTEFLVNQQIGGGTWVYLGHFEFDKGTNDYGMVVLSNQSKQKGVVCADAVRFGGGMGNIAREGQTSGLPRYLEGARYNAQWSGMPAEIYSRPDRLNDYADDLNTRSQMINYLSGGSVYNPTDKGLGVPFEMTLAFHSDAGFSKEDEWIGTLGVYTTNFNEGKLNSGVSRHASRDLTDMVMTELQQDISARYGRQWNRRGMWNRNYSETRLPAVPSMILEILSHQNFADMRMGHEPDFKFTVARSVYKAILKHTATMHGTDYVVQPLPVTRFAIQEAGKKFQLSWQGVIDPQEPSARPRGYIVYTRLGHGGWDNGTYVKENYYTFDAEPGLVYSFKVTAVNKGGESFPSEILSAYHAKENRGTVLIVNGFDRTSGPATYESDELQGFDMARDPGIPYISTTSYCGPQYAFDRTQIGKGEPNGLGYSTSEWEGKQIAGNTFDYPFVHGKAIQSAGNHSFVSCSDEAIEQSFIRMEDYPIVDLILGAEKNTLSEKLQQRIADYTSQGGNLLVSGSYLGSILPASIAQNTLKFTHGGSMWGVTTGQVFGANTSFTFPTKVNEKSYAVPAPDCLLPAGGAYSTFVYTPGNYGAGIAYKGTDYRTFVLGFPFESIDNAQHRSRIMKAALDLFK